MRDEWRVPRGKERFVLVPCPLSLVPISKIKKTPFDLITNERRNAKFNARANQLLLSLNRIAFIKIPSEIIQDFGGNWQIRLVFLEFFSLVLQFLQVFSRSRNRM